MSKAHAVAQHLPYLRRYARALTGSQVSGDAYVAATLEALVKAPRLLESEELPRITLFRHWSAETCFWNATAFSARSGRAAFSIRGRWSKPASLRGCNNEPRRARKWL